LDYREIKNGISFDSKPASLLDWRTSLKEDLGLVCIKAKKKIADPLCLFVSALWALQVL